MLCLDRRASERSTSHHGALGGGEVDWADAYGQSFLQVEEDVGADAGAGHGALGGRRLVQQLLEAVEFDQQHHVLQEIALDECRKLRCTEELHWKKMMERQERLFKYSERWWEYKYLYFYVIVPSFKLIEWYMFWFVERLGIPGQNGCSVVLIHWHNLPIFLLKIRLLKSRGLPYLAKALWLCSPASH